MSDDNLRNLADALHLAGSSGVPVVGFPATILDLYLGRKQAEEYERRFQELRRDQARQNELIQEVLSALKERGYDSENYTQTPNSLASKRGASASRKHPASGWGGCCGALSALVLG